MRTLGWSPSMTATTELVVPRSMPIIFAMLSSLLVSGVLSDVRGTRLADKTSVQVRLYQKVCHPDTPGDRAQVIAPSVVTSHAVAGRRGLQVPFRQPRFSPCQKCHARPRRDIL